MYELHIGTFTKEGTWRAAVGQLAHLAELGITVLEVMPVAEFPGAFGWGYDGVDLFAPSHLYGSPDDMRAFVDRAHALGLGVILDVVYNHLGPDGNYLKQFSPAYFTRRYRNEWGEAINFDGPDAAPVREFFATNAEYWIDEFHLDGLRLDATQQMFDASTTNIMAEIQTRTRAAAGKRDVLLVAENEPQQTRIVRPDEQGGYDLDMMWNDDFHHCAIAASIGLREAYYSDYRGTPQELLSALKYGFLYQGQYYAWQKKERGSSTRGIRPDRFIHFLENHDQVANTNNGRRLHQLTSAGRWRALTAVLLLSPQTPMLFQGQEFASSAPFRFFADHKHDLARAVEEGRANFIAQFSGPNAARASLPKPHDARTFEACKLDPHERDTHCEAIQLHKDLLALRRADPLFSGAEHYRIDGAVIDQEAFVVRYFGDNDDRLLLINLGPDIQRASIAEPLIAPPSDLGWQQLWSSEDVIYGGCGAAPVERGGEWRIPAHSATLLGGRST